MTWDGFRVFCHYKKAEVMAQIPNATQEQLTEAYLDKWHQLNLALKIFYQECANLRNKEAERQNKRRMKAKLGPHLHCFSS